MRKVILGMIRLTAVIVAVFCSYSSAFGKPAAHHIPVAVAASPAMLAKLETSPALRVSQVRDLAAARSMVEDRAVYGGLVLARPDGRPSWWPTAAATRWRPSWCNWDSKPRAPR